MDEQAKSPDLKERAADFIDAVKNADRVTVSTVNALGGWDSSHFSWQEVMMALGIES